MKEELMIRYHIALFLTLSMVGMQAADLQKVKIITSFLNGANVERKTPEIADEIDLTQKETNTKETFGNLRARAEARGTPWPIVAMLVATERGFFVDYLDLVELVRTHGTYAENDFRSSDKTNEVMRKAGNKFCKKFYSCTPPAIMHTILLHANQPTFSESTWMQYELHKNSGSSYNIKTYDIQAVLAIDLCADYVPALALQKGLDDAKSKYPSLNLQTEFWNNFIAQLPKETFEKTQQQLEEVLLKGLPS